MSQTSEIYTQNFASYLTILQLSPVTSKNYISDINFFFNWLSTNSDIQNFPHSLSTQLIETYRSSLLSLPTKTANRRLSALRKFCQFLTLQNYLPSNPSVNLSNIALAPHPPPDPQTQLLHQFARDLKLEGAAPSTITNYVADAKKLLLHPTPPVSIYSPSTAKRHLSSWKKFQLFLNRRSSPPAPAPPPTIPTPIPVTTTPSSPPIPTPISLHATHYLPLLIIPLIVFIIAFLLITLLTPPPQLLTPTSP